MSTSLTSASAAFGGSDVGRVITIHKPRPRWWHPVKRWQAWRERRWDRKHPVYILAVTNGGSVRVERWFDAEVE